MSEWQAAWNRCRLNQLLAEILALPSAVQFDCIICFPPVHETDPEVMKRLQELMTEMQPYVNPAYPPAILHGAIAL